MNCLKKYFLGFKLSRCVSTNTQEISWAQLVIILFPLLRIYKEKLKIKIYSILEVSVLFKVMLLVLNIVLVFSLNFSFRKCCSRSINSLRITLSVYVSLVKKSSVFQVTLRSLHCTNSTRSGIISGLHFYVRKMEGRRCRHDNFLRSF